MKGVTELDIQNPYVTCENLFYLFYLFIFDAALDSFTGKNFALSPLRLSFPFYYNSLQHTKLEIKKSDPYEDIKYMKNKECQFQDDVQNFHIFSLFFLVTMSFLHLEKMRSYKSSRTRNRTC